MRSVPLSSLRTLPRCRAALAIPCLLWAFSLAPQASAQCSNILDSGYTTGTFTYYNPNVHAQTFTPPNSGAVCEIWHGLDQRGHLDSYNLYVTNVNGAGLPPTNFASNYIFRALNQTSFNTLGGNGINAKVPVTTTLNLNAGTRYALIIQPVGSGYMTWRGNNGSPYAGGQAYWLTSGNWASSVPSDLTFRIYGWVPPPNNNNCSNAQWINPGTWSGTNVGATTDGSSGCGGDNDVWYRFRASCDGPIIVDTCTASFDSVLTVYQGTSCSNLTELTCNDDCTGNPCSGTGSCTAFYATCGQTYWIRVASYSSGATGTFSLTLNQVPQPPPINDNAPGAITIGNVTNLPYSTCWASTDGPSPCGALNDIWYRYTPPCHGLVRVDTCGSQYDSYLAVYTGSPGSFTQVPGACNDDNGPVCSGLQASLQFQGDPCTTYWIRVGGWAGRTGCGDLTVTCNPTAAANDQCYGAIPITPGVVQGTTLGATPSAFTSLNPWPCGSSIFTADVWYAYVPPCSGQMTVDTCVAPCAGTRYDTVLSVYTGVCGNTLKQVPGGCNDDANCGTGYWLNSRITVNVKGGVQYFIRVSGYAGRKGNFALTLAFQSAALTNDSICNAIAVPCGTSAFNTCGSTNSPEVSSCPINNDIWYSFTTPNCAGPMSVSTCSSPMDTVLAVYSGPCSSPNQVACNDNATSGPCNGTYQSYVSFFAAANTTYYVRIGSPTAGVFGSGVLTIDCPPSPSLCPPTTGSAKSILLNINGFASNTPWAFRVSIPCCFDLYIPNVPGVASSNNQDIDEDNLRDAFVAAINAACPGMAQSHPYDNILVFDHGLFSIKARNCNTSLPPTLSVGPANTAANALCVVVPSGLPTLGLCSFNPEIEQLPLSETDCNGNGEDDAIDILNGTSLDLNLNNVPDECDGFSARIASFGSSCPASSASLELKGEAPVLGNSVRTTLDGGQPNTIAFLALANSFPTPFPILPNCDLYIDPGAVFIVFTLPFDAQGHSEVTLAIPADPTIQGAELWKQAVVLDAGSPIGLGFSNALRWVFGF